MNLGSWGFIMLGLGVRHVGFNEFRISHLGL